VEETDTISQRKTLYKKTLSWSPWMYYHLHPNDFSEQRTCNVLDNDSKLTSYVNFCLLRVFYNNLLSLIAMIFVNKEECRCANEQIV